LRPRWVLGIVILNVLRLTLKDDTTDEQRADVLAALRRTAWLPWVSFSSVGPTFDDPLSLGYVVAIKDLEALEKYMHDPIHLAGDDVILPRVARLSAVRFSDDDPGIGAKVFALHQAKVAKYPEWGRLVESITGNGT
jgi:stress responsive alpha/beta barrel protein